MMNSVWGGKPAGYGLAAMHGESRDRPRFRWGQIPARRGRGGGRRIAGAMRSENRPPGSSGGRLPILDGSGTGGRLEAVEVFDGLAGMGGSGKNCPLVVLQHLEPVADVGRVVLSDFGRDVQVGTKEGRSQLGNQFLQ